MSHNTIRAMTGADWDRALGLDRPEFKARLAASLKDSPLWVLLTSPPERACSRGVPVCSDWWPDKRNGVVK